MGVGPIADETTRESSQYGSAQLPATTPVRTGDVTLTAGAAYGKPVQVVGQFRARRARVRVSGQTGKLDAAVYGADYARLTNSDEVQVTPAGPMEVALRPATIPAGSASVWVGVSGAAGLAASGTQGDLEGAQQVTSGAYPLPTSLTGAAPSANSVAVTILPDDPTPLSIAYSRTQIGFSVLGKIGTRLYGRNISTDQFAYSDDDGLNWTSAATTIASVIGVGVSAVEIISYPTYMMMTTLNGKIYRANLNDFANWTEKSVSDAPAGTTGRVGTLASVGGGTPRLFYTNYNAATDTPGVYVWRSGNGGDTWSKATIVADGRHGHAVAIDPVTTTTVYVIAGDSAPGRGLYRSTDNGVNWSQVNTDTRYGIDLRFAYSLTGAPNRIIMEGDGSAGSPLMLSFLSALTTGVTDPLIYPDTAPPDGGGSWSGSARAMCITSEGNLVFATTGEGGAIGPREGLWIAKGPWFTTPVLLEEWAQGSQPSWAKTIESGNYLYNGNNRITKPRFAGQ